jgi:hypothetical protein
MSPRRTDPRKKQEENGLPPWLIAIGVGVLVVVAVVVLFTLQTPSAPAPVTSGSTTAIGRTKGDPNAKVEFVEFSDFQ